MELDINRIITLETEERYVLIAKTTLNDLEYFLAMGIDSDNNVIQRKIAIFYDMPEDRDTYLCQVQDPVLIQKLVEQFKAGMSR